MKQLLQFLVFTLFMGSLQAQVGIGTTSPQGALDIVSSDTGVVIPRVSRIEDVTNGQGNPPQNGTMVYDTSREATCFYVDGKWLCGSFKANGTSEFVDPFYTPFTNNSTYIKASNTDTNDEFGYSVALSSDGKTLAIGSYEEASNATGVNGDQTNNSASASGAVYVFTHSGTTWLQQAYIKASNTGANDNFGGSISLSGDGNTLTVGAHEEASNATGINGDQTNNSASGSGAVYVFTRSGTTWSQQAYIKASNTGTNDNFGRSISLSGDGNTLAVGANDEDSNATGINGDQTNNSANNSGAVYIFTRSGTIWSQQAYIKASNTDASDRFGYSVALSGDGNTLAVGASFEDSNATGINSFQTNNSASFSGAVYVFTRSGTTWSQQAYIKASNTNSGDLFGYSIALSGDGNTLAVGARGEDSNAIGVNGDQTNNSSFDFGAVYAFIRSGTTWSQQAYIKASNTGINDWFGFSVALNNDGNTLAVGATNEDSNAIGVNGDQTNNSAGYSGAVYSFTRSGTTWSQQTYIKASNTDTSDLFSISIALNNDGNTLAVGAYGEASNATGVNGDQANNSASNSGAVYIYGDPIEIVGDGTGTDNQSISGSGLSGTDLTIGIQNGTSEVIDLSSLQDGTGTDNQNIFGSGLSGTDLTIGIQNGTSEVIGLSTLIDHDWYRATTTNQATNINDNIFTNGDVGIGGDPNANLHVFHSTNAGNDGFRIQNTAANNNHWRMYVANSSGNLNLYSRLHGNTTVGNFNDDTGVYSSTSDRRLKKDFKPLPFSWQNFMNLEALSYLYKVQKDDKRSLGLIAQDVELIYPELVTYNTESDVYHLNYSGFGVVAIKAVQELKDEVDSLKKENAILKAKLTVLEQLEARLTALEVSTQTKTSSSTN